MLYLQKKKGHSLPPTQFGGILVQISGDEYVIWPQINVRTKMFHRSPLGIRLSGASATPSPKILPL